MRGVKFVLVAATIACLAEANAAWACNVSGKVVCQTPEQQGIPGVTLSFTQNPYTYAAGPTDGNGAYSFSASNGNFGRWDVALDLDGEGSAAPYVTWVDIQWTRTDQVTGKCIADVATIEVPASLVTACAPQTCPALDGKSEETICPDRPIGSERAECKRFGLLPIVKIEDGGNIAAEDAALALVKAGNCYRSNFYVNAGETLDGPENGSAFSHVTYCKCPTTP